MTTILEKENQSKWGKQLREVEGWKARARSGERHSLLTFPHITLLALKHRFRNINKKTLILYRGCDCDFQWPSLCNHTAFIYSSAETQLVVSNLLASPDMFIYSSQLQKNSLIQNCNQIRGTVLLKSEHVASTAVDLGLELQLLICNYFDKLLIVLRGFFCFVLFFCFFQKKVRSLWFQLPKCEYCLVNLISLGCGQKKTFKDIPMGLWDTRMDIL